MADIYTRDQLKAWFKTGAKPTQAHFAALIDSLRHMSDTIDATAVAGLEDLLYTITDQEITTNLTAHNASTSSHNLGTVEEFIAAAEDAYSKMVTDDQTSEDDGIATASLDDESAAIPDESVTPTAAEIAAEAAKVAEEAAKLNAESATDETEATTTED